ncbi:uncharacterized protein MELLADRAFT_114021 [Melampsora larici-populina 98AG31]|uniref:Uncharacterized protein n=1 Tax=Melampsora larici-populina (strain 98AG31 / pathotype 3-4-7) TaxID=747676 RepID=F4SBV8_MELLP|nr:uncharacterized protein MELLADRAFT_114021 [Melampsora larici-populina 98AG31]EGF97875.1 hypothetical protein MELLADRAFT_114021 [Melampsora larici-populina 98AG31]
MLLPLNAQANRCQYEQQRETPASAPLLYNPHGPGSQALGLISPLPRPRNLPVNRSSDTLDSHPFFRRNANISTNSHHVGQRVPLSSQTSEISHASSKIPPDAPTGLRSSQTSNADDSVFAIGSQPSTSNNVNHHFRVDLSQSQTSHQSYQFSVNDVIPETPQNQIASWELSLPPSPTNLWNEHQSQSEIETSGKEPAVSMTLDGPDEVMHGLWLKYVVHSRQGVDPARGPSAAKNLAPKMFIHTFKACKFAVNINSDSFLDLKEQLFVYSDQMGKNAKGNSFIFKAADATNSVAYIAYIHSHEVYSKAAAIELTCDDDVKQFFLAISTHPKQTSGIDVLMEDPTKKKSEAEKNLSIGQHQLQAKNINANMLTSTLDLAHATPEDPVDTDLAALMVKYSTAKNNNAEGWWVYKFDDITKVMPINFQLLRIWAEHMVKDPSVTVDKPPKAEGFEWTHLKKTVTLQTPVTSGGSAMTHQPSPITPGTISEAQGYDIVVDPYKVDQIRTYTTMDNYMAFAGVCVGKVDEVVAILFDHDIERFNAFLYPEETGIKDLVEMGIQHGTAMRLMNCARRFYQHVLNDEIKNPKSPFDSSMVI